MFRLSIKENKMMASSNYCIGKSGFEIAKFYYFIYIFKLLFIHLCIVHMLVCVCARTRACAPL